MCDGRLDCTDGSDEVGCSVTASVSNAGPLTCRFGSKLCRDGSDCVMYSHICDGEVDCKDKSDEEGCDLQCNPGRIRYISDIKILLYMYRILNDTKNA